jgi:hypothetical protein
MVFIRLLMPRTPGQRGGFASKKKLEEQPSGAHDSCKTGRLFTVFSRLILRWVVEPSFSKTPFGL